MNKTALLLATITTCCSFDGLDDMVAKTLWISRQCNDEAPEHVRAGVELEMGDGWTCLVQELDRRRAPAVSEVRCWDSGMELEDEANCAGESAGVQVGDCGLMVQCRGITE